MDFSLKKTILIVLAFFAVANLLLLDIILLRTSSDTSVKSKEEDTPSQVNVNATNDECGESCQSYINEQISELQTNTIPQDVQQNAVEEVYIPLGSATTQLTSWQSVPGLEAQVDTTKYPNIASATFEATVTNPNATQQVSLQLYDATNNHPVWFSQVSYQGGSSQTLISNPITLSSGNVTYQVQAQTQLGAPTQIINARIHLILQ